MRDGGGHNPSKSADWLLFLTPRHGPVTGSIRYFGQPLHSIMVIAASWIRSPGRFERLVWLLVARNVLFAIGSGATWRYVAGHPLGEKRTCDPFKGWTIWGAGSWTGGVGTTAATTIAFLPFPSS